METALQVHEEMAPAPVVAHEILAGGNPADRLAQAVELSNTLAPVIRQKQLFSNIGGREYVRFEGWTLLGSLVGVFPVTVWSRPIEDGEGWEARVEARMLDGTVVGAAEAICTRSERNWSNRDTYALRSMAQTRAGAKALRMPLGFVIQLAGFETTPADEVPPEGFDAAPPSPRRSGKPRKAGAITEKQRGRLWAITYQAAEEAGVGKKDAEEALRAVCAKHQIASTNDIPSELYDEIVDAVQAEIGQGG